MGEGNSANYCIVVKPGSRAIALSRTADGYRLPVILVPKPFWLAGNVAELNSQLMGAFGLNCTLLRWLSRAPDTNLVLMEWHPGSAFPETGIEWLDPLGATPPLPAPELQMIRDWQSSSTAGLPPWEQPGWMRQIVFRLIRIFDGVHHPKLTTLLQFKAAWGMSTLMLIETSKGNFFFKAGIRQGVEEYDVLRFLHGRFPRYVRDPYLVDEREGWMISKGIEHMTSTEGDYANAEAAFRIYGEIQLGCDEFMRSEKAKDLRIRDASWLNRHFERLFSGADCPAEFAQAVSSQPVEQLGSLRETWARQIDELSTSRLPLTFNQEDFHFDNVLNTGEGPVFIDWADCAKSHPFFSVHRALTLWRWEDPEHYESVKDRVIDGYLDRFSHLASSEELKAEFELAGQLSRLYQAFLWQERSHELNHESAWGSFCFDRAALLMKRAIQKGTETGGNNRYLGSE